MRYSFPLQTTVSLIGGHGIRPGVHYPFGKVALSVGKKIANTHIELNLGSFLGFHLDPFFGLSVSIPIKKW